MPGRQQDARSRARARLEEIWGAESSLEQQRERLAFALSCQAIDARART